MSECPACQIIGSHRPWCTLGDPAMSDLIDFLKARFAEDDPHGAWDGPSLREASRYELKRRAQRYADHPGYRPEWKP